MNEIERQAPELRVQKWIGKDGESIAPFKLSISGPARKSCLPSSIGAKVAICMGFRRYKSCMQR
ncbi:hypothetical protein P4132_00695 [Pseudomonas aeruginosa]|nr:hypothetical protein [Pseudomonas aeruginosa]